MFRLLNRFLCDVCNWLKYIRTPWTLFWETFWGVLVDEATKFWSDALNNKPKLTWVIIKHPISYLFGAFFNDSVKFFESCNNLSLNFAAFWKSRFSGRWLKSWKSSATLILSAFFMEAAIIDTLRTEHFANIWLVEKCETWVLIGWLPEDRLLFPVHNGYDWKFEGKWISDIVLLRIIMFSKSNLLKKYHVKLK